MSETFRAFRIHRHEGTIRCKLESLRVDDLSPGDVLVRVDYSGINYKDALAATGAGRILRRYPLVGGIDLAGEVFESTDSRFEPGDRVVCLGAGMSETRDGGYAEIARLDGDMLTPLPESLSSRDAMAIGTAGFTAALAIDRLERNGLQPGQGPVLVSGATGGVGSIAIDLLASRGYEVVALTGKIAARRFLETLGAGEVLDRRTLELGTKPLEHARWAAAIDNLGGDVLAWLTRTTKPWGGIASVGLAAGATLETTVMPFILRAVSLIGINMELDPTRRREIWARLTGDLRTPHLDEIAAREVSFDELPGCFDEVIAATTVGRTIVRVAG